MVPANKAFLFMADNITLSAAVGTFLSRAVEKIGGLRQVVMLDLGAGAAEAIATGTIPVSGAVSLDAPTLAALENTTVTVSGSVATLPPVTSQSTRQYNLTAGVTRASGLASAEVALGTLGASREVRLRATQAAFINFGTVGLTTASSAGTSLPIDIGDFHLIVPVGATHIAAIRESVDGIIHVTPVA